MKKKKNKCGFCEKDSVFSASKFRCGFFMKTNFCEDHASSYSNGFYKKMETIRNNFYNLSLFNDKKDFLNISEKILKRCPNCNLSIDIFITTGFTRCSVCLEHFFGNLIKEFEILLKIKEKTENSIENKVIEENKTEDEIVKKEIIENKEEIVEKQTLIEESIEESIEDKIKRHEERIIVLIKEIKKTVKNQDFEKAATLRDERNFLLLELDAIKGKE
jgi:protein-arginine kinase activator protein McsA